MLFTDTVTLFNKIDINGETSWIRTTCKGVQWSDHCDKENQSGKISVARYASITFPVGTYEDLLFKPSNEEDAIFYGVIDETPIDVRGYRLSDLLEKYPKSGRVQSVNDNSNRTHLKNIKVVVA